MSDITININDELPFVKKVNGKINYSKKKVLFSELSGNFGEFDLISREITYLFGKYLAGIINLKGRLNPSINLNKIIPKNSRLMLKILKILVVNSKSMQI